MLLEEHTMAERSVTTESLLRVIEFIRTRWPDMQLQQAHILLLIASAPGLTQAEIRARSGLTSDIVSRNCGLMSNYAKGGRGWVTKKDDPDDSRRVRMYLTAEGRQFVDAFTSL